VCPPPCGVPVVIDRRKNNTKEEYAITEKGILLFE